MGDVIRRDKTVPVQARRADGGAVPPFTPGVTDVPSAGGGIPPPPPVVAGGAVQNVIYVVAPPAAAAAVQEVRHHHHTTVVAPVRRRRLGKGTSFLGTLGLVVGGVAGATAFLPQVAAYAPWIAKAGLAMAALAWVGAVLLRRVGAGMPFLGMAVSAAAWAACLYTSGQAQGTYDHLRTELPLPAVQFPAPPAASVQRPVDPVAPMGPALPSPTPRAVPAVPRHDGTIFDTDSPGWVKPGATTKP